MTTATRNALRRLRSRFGMASVVAALLVVFVSAAAFAYWTTTGGGSGSAAAATLNPPAGVTATPSGASVTVGFTGVAPSYGPLTGYYVTRYQGVTPSNACGTSPLVTGTYLSAAATSCVDSGVANGTYTYRVTAVYRTWTAQSTASAGVVVNADPTPPTQAISLASGAGTSYLTGGTVYYRGDLAGTFTLSSAVTDTGTGPASASFPAIAASGWTHTAANPTTGTGSAPTITYFGGTYGWGIGATSPGTHTVTGSDVQGNVVNTNLAFASDTTGPTGGALVVAGGTGTSVGTIAYSTTGTFTGSRTNFTADAGSGAATSVLHRAVGTLSGGLCSGFGTATVVAGNPSETTLPTGCYRYTLTGTDNVGNTSVLTTTVQVDSVAPTHSLTETGANSFWSSGSSTLYYRSNVAGSFTLTDDVTDLASGPYRAVFPAVVTAGWTHSADTVTVGTSLGFSTAYTSSTYSWLSGATSPLLPERTVTARDMAGNDSTLVMTFTGDAIVPASGALTLNSTAANGGGSTSSSSTGTFTGTRTAWSDLGSGIATDVLTREVGTLSGGACSAYAAPTTVAGVPSETALATGCYRYTLTGTDNVGNTASISTVVRVDRDAPTQSLVESGSNSHLDGTTLYYRGGTAGSMTLASTVTDGQLGPKDVTYPAFATSGWGHTGSETVTGTNPYVSSAITWTGAAGTPPTYTVTARDFVDNSVATALTFVNDSTAPVGGALSVNGEAGTGGGSTSTSATGSFTGTYTAYTDAGSGLAAVNGNRITRETAPLVNGVCGAYGSLVDVTWTSETNLPTGCYLYTASGLDNVGNTASVATTVQVDREAPTQAFAETGTNSHLIGSTLYFNSNVGNSFTLTDTVTDNALGPNAVTFPDIAASGWDHAAETVTPSGGTLPVRTFDSSAFTWVAGAATPPMYGVSATDVAGNSGTSTLTITPDATGPTGGSLVVNGVTGTAGGEYSADTNGWTGTFTEFSSDAGSGLDSSALTLTVSTNTACTTWGAATTLSGGTITQGGVTANRCYRYVLTGLDNVGNAEVRTVTVFTGNDNTNPTQAFTATGDGYATGTTLYYRSGAAGSLVLTSTVTDYQSGPAQVVFGTASTSGLWSHTAQTVTSGVGTAPTVAYTSSTYSWSGATTTNPSANFRRVNASDNDGNASNVTLTFTADGTSPTGGALSVNGTTGTAGGATAAVNVSGNVTGTRTDYSADTGSGLSNSVLTREYAPFSSGTTCSTSYGAATVVVGAPNDSGLASGCWRYTLTGLDQVGNASVLSVVVPMAPGSLSQAFTLNSTRAVLDGTVIYYNPTTASLFTLDSAVTGVGSNPSSVNFPAIGTTGWTHNNQTDNSGTGTLPTLVYNSTNFSWTANPTLPTSYTVTATNVLGNTAATTFTFDADQVAPTGGGLTVDGVAGTTGGVTNFSSDGDGSYGVTTSAFTDTESGVGSTTVTRAVGTLTNGVCSAFGGATTFTGTSETNLGTGCYRYSVTATDRVGNVSTALVATVMVDRTAPTQTFTAIGADASVTGTTVYFRSSVGSSFVLRSTVTDTGSSPKQVEFPDLAAIGWNHPAETVTPGVGTTATRTFDSSPYTWGAGAGAPASPAGRTISAFDTYDNQVDTTLTFVSDTTVPTGGALTVNGVVATAGGASGASTTGTYTGTRTNYSADTGSGLGTSVLTREAATYSGGTCGTYGAPAVVAGTPSETTVATGCYRYTLTGTDNVGNATSISAVVQVDRDAPTQVVTASGPNASVTGTTVYYRSNLAGSFTLTSAVTDNGSGAKQVTFPAIGTAGWTHNAETVTTGTGTNPISYTSTTYSWTANPTNPTTAANRTLTATDQAGNAGTTVLTFTPDNVAPITGALTVNATVATVGGSTSHSSSTTVTGTRTDYTDGLSGIASSVLTRTFATVTNGVCGTFGAATTIVGNPNDIGLAAGCYRYTLTGTDNLGNAASVTTTVVVDTDVPTQVVTMTGGAGAAVLSGNTVYYRPGVAGSFALSTAVTDSGGGPASAAYPAIATTGWTHNAQTVVAGTGSAPTIAYASTNFSWTANPSVPGAYTVTGADVAGNTVTTVLNFVPDTTGPTGGALTVNAVTGTAGGATGYSNTGTFTGTFTNYNADAGVGFQSSVLTREYAATLTNGVCGTYAASTTIGAISETTAAAGCYRYTLTGTDVVGNPSVLSVIVQVDKTNPTMTIVDTSPNASYNAGTNTMYYRGGLASTFNWTASVTDGASGPKQVVFPAIATTGWTHNAETVTTGTGASPTIAYVSGAYSWTPTPTNPTGAGRTITGSDLAGNTVSITPTFVTDTTAPTGGALTVNGTVASGGGSTSTSSATSWTIGTRTDYNADTGSGFASSVLTREAAPWNGTTCGTYAAPVTIAGTAAQTGMAGGYCYRYVLTGTDNVGNVTSLTTTVRTNLLITSVALNNGSFTSGTLNRTDTMVVQFSGPIAVSSLCSTWSGDTTNQTVNGNNVVGVTIREGAGAANDYIQVTTSAAACGGAFNFGTVTLGDDGYLESTTIQTFRGTGANASTIAYNATTYTLTITLGINETTPGDDGSNNVNGNTTATYAPGGITGTGGIAITGGGTTAAVRQF